MKALKYLFILTVLCSCGPLISYDYQKSTDFSKYKSYNYFDDMETGLSHFDQKRIIKAIDSILLSKGIERSESADFYIDLSSRDVQPRNNPSVGVAVGGTGNNVGGGVSVGVPVRNNFISREITIDFVDLSKGEKLIWRAVSEALYKPNDTPEKREEHFNSLVGKILAKYPPKK